MTSLGRRLATVLGASVLAATVVSAPTSAQAVPAQTEDSPAANCTVDSATLNWGMRQSFRQYITGAIAGGSWQTYGGARYVEPELSQTGAVQAGTDLFQWEGGAGSLDSDVQTGLVNFTGGVHFTGHEGGLELNIANPSIEFDGEGAAYLLLEVSEAPAGTAGTQVRAAKLDLTDRVNASGQDLSIEGATVRLTAEGSSAFNGDTDRGTYVAGQEMDPLFLAATVSGCDLGEVVASALPADDSAEGTTDITPISAENAEPQVPWVPIVIGGVALLVIVVAAGLLLAGRKKPAAASTSASDTAEAEPEGEGRS